VGGRAGNLLRADAVLFRAQEFFALWGIILSATVATAAVADDLKSGAFQFYFSRPLRADDYVRGKLLGLFVLIGFSTLVGPLFLSIVRVGLVTDFAEAVTLLPVIPKALALGVASTAALVLPAAGLGALLGRRIAAQAAYILYWVVIAQAAKGVSRALDLPYIGLLALDLDVRVIGGTLFEVRERSFWPEAWQAALAILVISIAGYAALRARIRAAATTGLGGG
jgi:hypothetical protein